MLRGVDLELLLHRDHYPAVIERVLGAARSVWIATANLKELMIEDPRVVPGRRRGRAQYRSVLAALSELAARGVELRILHAAEPSRVFRRDFDRQKRLVSGGLELRLCPRTHLKLVIVDGRDLYLGSANWTGAGLGAKHTERRNFELGMLTQDERLLDAAQDTFERIWRGAECEGCRLREVCPMPLDVVQRSERKLAARAQPAVGEARARKRRKADAVATSPAEADAEEPRARKRRKADAVATPRAEADAEEPRARKRRKAGAVATPRAEAARPGSSPAHSRLA